MYRSINFHLLITRGLEKLSFLFYRTILTLSFFLTVIVNNYSQETGTITGTVLDKQNGEALVGANVFLEGTTIGAATDLEGVYRIINIPSGSYTLYASMVGYTKLIVTNTEVKNNEVLKLDLVLLPEAIETDEVVITAQMILDNEASLLKNRQKSNSISDAISSEQLSRTGSSDVGDAMKKVVGSTVVDGKYVYVRGLGDRYSSTQLNGTELPSTDPNKKAFQLDLIPTNLLNNIVTIKTFTPDKPGNFSGGIVDIGTKSFPEQFTFKLSGSSSYNSNTSFNNNFLTYEGGDKDWLGFDDGTRDVPDVLQNNGTKIPVRQEARFNSEKALALDLYSKSFNSIMSVNRGKAPINQSYALSIGNQVLVGDESKFGYIGSLTYGRSFTFYEDGTVGRYTVSDLQSQTLNPQLLVSDSKGTSEANIGGLLSVSYNFSPTQQVGGNVFYSRSGISLSRSQVGAWPQEFGTNPNAPTFYNQVLSWTERDILSYQLRGEHLFGFLFNTSIDWTASYSTTSQDEPDFRLLSYNIGQTANGPNYIISGSGFPAPSRYFRELDDRARSFQLNFSIPFQQWNSLGSKFKIGFSYQDTKRTFRERIFAYSVDNALFNQLGGDLNLFFDDRYVGLTSIDTVGGNVRYNFGNVITDNSRLKNNYDGDLYILGAYGMIELPITQRLKFIGGVRYETTDLSVVSKDLTSDEGKVDEKDFLPSLNLVFSLTENMNIRLAATQTLARPNFREIAPYSTKEFVNDVELQGNPNLKRSLITNYDLRWEWFTNPGEILAVSGFYKHLKDPIELYYQEVSNASNPVVQYNNVDKAIVAGIELELRLGLGQILDFLSDFYLGTNLSLIYSEIDISQGELADRLSIDSSSSRTRELQGQSPYVLNIDLSYSNSEIGTNAGLYFNSFGERLSKVSANVNPDVFEQPAAVLNFTLSQRLIQMLTLNFGIQNLLNTTYKEVARFKGNDYIFHEYKRGITYSLGLSYSL